MATPLGHSIVGYTLARAAGVKSRRSLAIAIGAANLPDVDFLMGYVANGDLLSLHHGTITHRRAFPLLAGAAVGLATALASLARGRPPRPGLVLRSAAVAASLVASHVVMDRLPLPYDTMAPRPVGFWQVAASQTWNAVIDVAVYGAVAMAIASRNGNGNGNGHQAAPA
jgi:hypothetical protein